MKRFPDITIDNIIRHSDISPSRKIDPGPVFDMVYLLELVKQYLHEDNINEKIFI